MTVLPNFNFEIAVLQISQSGITTIINKDSNGNISKSTTTQWANDACLKWNMINLGYGFVYLIIVILIE